MVKCAGQATLFRQQIQRRNGRADEPKTFYKVVQVRGYWFESSLSHRAMTHGRRQPEMAENEAAEAERPHPIAALRLHSLRGAGGHTCAVGGGNGLLLSVATVPRARTVERRSAGSMRLQMHRVYRAARSPVGFRWGAHQRESAQNSSSTRDVVGTGWQR